MKKELSNLGKALRSKHNKEIRVNYGLKQQDKKEFSITLFAINIDIRTDVKEAFSCFGTLIDIIDNYNGIQGMIKYLYKLK